MNVLEVQTVPITDDAPTHSEPIVEVPVLLESWLLKSLEAAARENGLSTGNMVRRLIRDFVYYSDGDLSTP